MAENTYVNKVVFGNDTLLDLTEDSVTENTLLEGETAHKASGEPITGTAKQGHVIEDTNGTALTQRADLQFVGVYTEDDSANDRTKVNVVRTMTKAQMDALSASEKVGFIRTSDEADNPYIGGGGAVDVLIAPTNSITQEITVDLSLYSLLLCSKGNSTGKTVYAQSVVAPQQILSGLLTNVNLYDTTQEVDYVFTSSGGARISGLSSGAYGALYGVRK